MRVALAALAVLAIGIPHAAAQSLIRNGSFTEGARGEPTGWHTDAWSREISRFEWRVEPDGTGTISITNSQPNDARWCQTIPVEPGREYRVTARTRTQDVGLETAGALITIEPRIGHSADVRGTAPWQTLQVVARAGVESTWDVCTRLGSYSNLNVGTAWYTDVAVVPTGPGPRAATTGWFRRTWFRGGWRAAADVGWVVPTAAIAGGILLALGFGILGRVRPDDRPGDDRPSDPW